MPKLKNYGPGKRINIWIPERQLKLLQEIENHSKFFQLALDNAVGIMSWSIIKKQKDITERAPTEEEVTEFNKNYPLDELTKKRLGKDKPWQSNSQNKPELW